MDAPDDHTVILTLKKADANALEDINSRVIMKQSAAEKMGEADNPPIGTGPFKFTSWDRTGQFVIRRNENYWGQPPKIDEVIYKEIQEDAARIAALKRARRISSATCRRMKWSDLNPIRGCACSRCRDCGRFFSCSVRPTSRWTIQSSQRHDPRHRSRADHQTYVGRKRLSIEGPARSAGIRLRSDARAYPYDPEKAKQLFTEAGFPTALRSITTAPPGDTRRTAKLRR